MIVSCGFEPRYTFSNHQAAGLRLVRLVQNGGSNRHSFLIGGQLSCFVVSQSVPEDVVATPCLLDRKVVR